MNAARDEVLKKVSQWLEYGDEDLRLAKHALTLSTAVPYRLIAYHAQQCAEKHLKAFLVFKNVDFPYTHNISILLEICAEHAQWPASLQDAEELTAFAITARYPGEDEEVTQEDALRAIDIASSVRGRAREALADEGMRSV